MYNNTYGLERNLQSVSIDPLAGSTLGVNKTRSIKVLPSDDSSRQNAQFVVLEEILLVASENTNAPPPTSATVSSPLLIVRALPNAVTWDNLDEVKEQRKYEMSTWKMYDRITTSRMRKVHSTGGLPPKFPSLPEQQRRLNTIDELNRCHAVSTLDSLADEPFEMDLL